VNHEQQELLGVGNIFPGEGLLFGASRFRKEVCWYVFAGMVVMIDEKVSWYVGQGWRRQRGVRRLVLWRERGWEETSPYILIPWARARLARLQLDVEGTSSTT